MCQRESSNDRDLYAVAVIKYVTIIEHVITKENIETLFAIYWERG